MAKAVATGLVQAADGGWGVGVGSVETAFGMASRNAGPDMVKVSAGQSTETVISRALIPHAAEDRWRPGSE